MLLKPQDTLLALKYWSLKGQGKSQDQPQTKPRSMRELAESIKVSVGEISKSTKRLMAAHLVVERGGRFIAETGALQDWLCFGVRHAYPAEIIGFGRGMPTAWNCPLVRTDIMPPDPPLVWDASGGSVEGAIIKPIHDSIPFADSSDELLYEALSLVEAIRTGKPRELSVARDEFSTILKSYESHWKEMHTI